MDDIVCSVDDIVNTDSVVGELQSDELLQALPAAVYTTDAAGLITFYNDAAAALWGYRPELGKSEWCGSWRLYWPDGRPMARDECPMAVALKEKRPIRGAEAVAERPDGTRIPFLAYPTPLWDGSGALSGAVNMLVDITDRKEAEYSAQRLAAIVESSDDAIVSIDLNGIITTLNPGAERLFGYTGEELIGKPVTILIPQDRHDEETEIIERLRRGQRVEHYETVRRRKDGSLVEISLTVSSIKDIEDRIIGASKITHYRAQTGFGATASSPQGDESPRQEPVRPCERRGDAQRALCANAKGLGRGGSGPCCCMRLRQMPPSMGLCRLKAATSMSAGPCGRTVGWQDFP